jgi:Bacterial membrane protein YfhO
MLRHSPEGAETTQRSLERWFTPWRFAVVLALLIVAAFPDVVSGAGTFFLRDFGIFTYPLAHYQRESFWRGELPLWNPLSSCGIPFLAQWGTLVLYPPALFYLLLPLSWSLGMFCLLHLFLAGFGMYRLAGRWTANRFAGAVGGVAFAFNGAVLCSMSWASTIAGLAWMPWVILCAERARLERGRRRVLVATGVGALQMLSGAPEVILLTWVLAGVLWLGEVQIADFRLATQFRRLGRLLAVVGLVAGLSAVQLLPFFDLLRHSQRSSEFGNSLWSMPLWGWADFLVPLFHCFPSHQGVFVQFGQYWLPSYYPGIGVVALAMLAACRVRARRVRVLAMTLLIALLLALGDPGYVYHWVRLVVPQIGFMRFPVKFVLVAVFILPLLGSFAVAWFLALPEGEARRAGRWIAGLGLVLALLIVVVLIIARRFPLPTDRWPATWHCGVGRLAFLGLIVGAFLVLRRVRPASAWLWGLAVLALLWLDVLTHAPRLNPTVSRRACVAGWARAQLKLDPAPRPGGPRVMVSPQARARLLRLNLGVPLNDYSFSRLGFLGDCNLLDGVPKVNGFYPLYPRPVEVVRELLYATTNTSLPRFADFLGVAHITAPDKMIEWRTRRSYLPLVTAGQRPVFADEASTLRVLASSGFDPRRTVYLPVEARRLVTVTRSAPARILQADFTDRRVRITVKAEAPSLVVIAQTYYHLWRATVDGRPAPLLRANFGFQAVQAPAGTHRVDLVYVDPNLRAGAVVSGLTLLGCLVGWFGRTTTPRPGDAPEP